MREIIPLLLMGNPNAVRQEAPQPPPARPAPDNSEIAAKLRAEHIERKRANFEKRKPKA